MSTWKTKAAIGIGTMGLAMGALSALAPEDPDHRDPIRGNMIERNIDDLSDADEKSKDRMRDEGTDGIGDENSERLRPVEPTPGGRPKVRIRLP